MQTIHKLTALCVLVAAAAGAGSALAAAAAAAKPAPTPGYTVKMTNADAMAVTAVYASPTGKNDWGDDLLGRQTAAAGKTVTLNFKPMAPELCLQDLQLLMTDGKSLTKEKLDVCQTPVYRFER